MTLYIENVSFASPPPFTTYRYLSSRVPGDGVGVFLQRDKCDLMIGGRIADPHPSGSAVGDVQAILIGANKDRMRDLDVRNVAEIFSGAEVEDEDTMFSFGGKKEPVSRVVRSQMVDGPWLKPALPRVRSA